MTIDINELREAIQTFGSQAINEGDLNELLDRLEAAENDIALKERIIDSLGSTLDAVSNERDALCTENAGLVDDMNLLRNNNATLRTKIKAMERQEPVAHVWRCDNGHIHGSCESELLMGQQLYALPGAQPQLNEIKIALQRALGLGQRETWTGARKHRSWEDQREEQQCWNKVWNLLGAQGEEK